MKLVLTYKRNSFCNFPITILLVFHYFILPSSLSAQPLTISNAFYYSSELVIDSKGNLFVTGKNKKIIKITPGGAVFDFAGNPKGHSQEIDGTGAKASFSDPKGIAIDNDDNIYVADYTTVRKIMPDATVTTIYGKRNIAVVKDGNQRTATFRKVDFIAVDNSGVLYVTDEIIDSLTKRKYNIIRKITPDGTVTTIRKNDGNIYKAAWIYGMACDKDRNLYISAVAWTSSIDKITPDGTVTTIAGKYSEDRTKPRASFKEGAANNVKLTMPYGITVSKNGDVYFSEANSQKILKLANNQVTTIAGKAKDAALQNPHGVSLDKTGNLYFVDASGTVNSFIRKVSSAGIISIFCKQEWNSHTKQYESVSDNIVNEPPANTGAEPPPPQKNNTAEDEAAAIKENYERLADSLRLLSKQTTNTYADKKFETLTLPVKDTARIKRISARNFSVPEIRSLMKDLYGILIKKLPRGAVESAQTITAKLNNNPKKVEEAALIAWQNGSLEESVLLITAAASNPASDGLILINTGAILDMSGLSEKAIPVLRTIVRIDPQNAIAQNNLGQAFYTLGMIDSAVHHLEHCINLSTQHPEANNTLGFIELKRGNKSNAKLYFENSILGGFNLHAYNGLLSIKKDYKVTKLIKPNVKIPDYFNQFKYKLPRQCTNTDMAEAARKEHEVFKTTMHELQEKYSLIKNEAADRFSSSGIERLKKIIAKGKSLFRPFHTLAYIMALEITADYMDEKIELNNTFNKEYKKQYLLLEQEYKTAYKKMMEEFGESESGCCGEGNTSCCINHEKVCNAVTVLNNRYLPKFALLTEDWQTRNLLPLKKYFDEIIYWNYLSSADNDDFKIKFYSWVNSYLYELDKLCVTKTFTPCVLDQPGEIKKPEESKLKEYDCPVSLSLPFIVGKLNLDCESFSLKAGQGIIFRYEKNFVTRQSTVSIGLGEEIYKGTKTDTDIKLHMSVFLCFDKSGNITDGGLVSEAKASFSLGFGSGVKLKFKEGVGWRLGFNSGLSLTPGFLKNVIDNIIEPAKEKPVNKNIKIYNQ